MSSADRIDRLLEDLVGTLETAAQLVDRGRGEFDTDPALPLAFEALSNRVGDISKKLVAADSIRFGHGLWSLAAKNRDFVVHHYNTVDADILWQTVAISFPEMQNEIDRF